MLVRVVVRLLVLSVLPLGLNGAGLAAQGHDRIWGTVETASGVVHQGFIRWDRDQASPADLLTGTRAVPREKQRIWRVATGRGEDLPRRVVEVAGFRVSWNEDDPDFPSAVSGGVRFGHIREIRPTGGDAAVVVLRSGQEVGLSGGGTDLGRDMRDLVVQIPGGDQVSLEWSQITRVVFEPAPQLSSPVSSRLHGTVTDRWGNRYSGYVTWDRDEVLAEDVLDGVAVGSGDDAEIPFSDIASLEREWEDVRVTLLGGEARLLNGTNDVGRGNRGVRISDPGLGRVEVPWEDFQSLRLHPPEPDAASAEFDGGHPLRGEVTTRGGGVYRGRIMWDGDEDASWQILDGERRGVRFHVEFGQIRSVHRVSSRTAQLTLLDGRTLELEGSSDVGEGNRGILVLPDGSEEWVAIPWDELQAARFQDE